MSAIRNLHLELGFEYPSGPTTLLSRVMRGITRSSGVERPRLPITTPLLRLLCTRLGTTNMRHPSDLAMLRAAFTLAFHGFLRCGELTSGLSRDQIRIDSSDLKLTLHLHRSKTDPSGHGCDITVGQCPDQLICPVAAMKAYLNFHHTPSAQPLFVYHNGSQLTRQDVTRELRVILPLCGVSDVQQYASHSFRIGAATSAAIAGVPDHLIRHMGRWQSDCVLRYIRVDPGEVIQVSHKLASVQ